MNLYIYAKSNALSCLTSILLTFVVNHQTKQKQLNIVLEVFLKFAIKEMHLDFLSYFAWIAIKSQKIKLQEEIGKNLVYIKYTRILNLVQINCAPTQKGLFFGQQNNLTHQV